LTELAFQRDSRRLVAGIAIPLALASAAFLVAWTSDQVESIGPLDRATVFWVIGAPLWLVSPIVAGFIWHRLTLRQAKRSAAVVGLTIGVAIALLFWQWVGVPQDCGFGTVTPAVNYLPEALVVGALVGSSLALPGLLVSWLFHTGVRWWAVVVGLGLEAVLLGLGYAVGVVAILVHGCTGAAPPV
jgi:hypothetical protein